MVRHRGSPRRIAALFLGLLGLLAVPPLGAQVVAPLSTQLPGGAPDSAAMSARFDSLLAAALTGAGFTPLEPAQTDSAWRGTIAAVGGYFDPHSGGIIPERLRAVRATTLAALHDRSGATLLLYSRVVVVLLRHDGDRVEWDGVRDKIGSAGKIQGEVSALSLVVIVTDSAGERIHCGRGGIQLLEKGNFWHAPRRVEDRKVLTDLARDSTAVALALADLIAHRPSCRVTP